MKKVFNIGDEVIIVNRGDGWDGTRCRVYRDGASTWLTLIEGGPVNRGCFAGQELGPWTDRYLMKVPDLAPDETEAFFV